MIEKLRIAKFFLYNAVSDHFVVADHLVHKIYTDLKVIERAERLHMNLLQLFNVVLLYGIVLESYDSLFSEFLLNIIWKAVWQLVIACDYSSQ